MSDPSTTKWGTTEQTRTVRHFHDRIRATVAARRREQTGSWRTIVVDRQLDLLSAADLARFEAEFLAQGLRFQASARISLAEAPEKYEEKVAVAGTAREVDASGRQEVGSGDNLVQADANVRGVARFIATLEQVTQMLIDGVPPDTIAVIDDSGGTLTAPILEGFKAVACLGGTVRSHLGILTREYGIPCLMNCQIDAALRDGDAVELEISAPAITGNDYESGTGLRARIWKCPEGLV